MKQRMDRVKSIIEHEKIKISDMTKYNELLMLVSEEQFETHVEGLKAMCVTGKHYVIEPTELPDNNLTLKVNEVTEDVFVATNKEESKTIDLTEKKEAESKPVENKTEEKPAENVQIEAKKEEIKEEIKPEAKEEIKPELKMEVKNQEMATLEVKFSEINQKLADLLGLVQSGKSKQESLELSLKSFQENITNEVMVIRKKYKDLQDADFAKGNGFSLDLSKSMKNDIASNVAPKVNLGDMLETLMPTKYQGAKLNFTKTNE